MKRIYFSHSYNDKDINEYFLKMFSDHDVELVADQKSDVWCVAKLEKYMNEADGFVSVVPERLRENEPDIRFSPYIHFEIELARRAGIPRLIFVDEVLRKFCGTAFPPRALPFHREQPQRDEAVHRNKIKSFCEQLKSAPPRTPDPSEALRRAVVFSSPDTEELGIVSSMAELLESRHYDPQVIEIKDRFSVFSDARILEGITMSEFGMYTLTPEPSPADLAMAVAYGLVRPSFRTRYDQQSKKSEPDLHGWYHWQSAAQLRPELETHLSSYVNGFLEAVLQEEDPAAWLTKISAEEKRALWDLRSPISLVDFVEVGSQHLGNDLHAIRKQLGTGTADKVLAGELELLCKVTYDRIQQYEWLYDFELGDKDYARQRIRTPQEMHANRVGTCLDFACLFSALLENMHAQPVIVIVTNDNGTHAVAGCWRHAEPDRNSLITDGAQVRQLIQQGELILFETTGAARAYNPVAGEQRDATGFLSFADALATASTLMQRDDLTIQYLLDVEVARTDPRKVDPA